jgi:hypothetical protein
MHGPLTGIEVYEDQFMEKLQEMIAKFSENGIVLRYAFPAGTFQAVVYQLHLHGRKIRALLQQPPSDSRYRVIELDLPDEETAMYRSFEDGQGGMYLSVAYPQCNHTSMQISGWRCWN